MKLKIKNLFIIDKLGFEIFVKWFFFWFLVILFLLLIVTTQPASLRALPSAGSGHVLRSNLSTYRRIPQAVGEIASSNRVSCACERSAPRKDG